MNYKRGKPRRSVRCTLCTDNRDYTGGDRLEAKRGILCDESIRSVPGSTCYDWCPDCFGTGKCEDCEDGVCILCGGTRVSPL